MRESVGGDLPVDVWIDGDGLLRASSTHRDVPGRAAQRDRRRSIDLYDFGVPSARARRRPPTRSTDRSSSAARRRSATAARRLAESERPAGASLAGRGAGDAVDRLGRAAPLLPRRSRARRARARARPSAIVDAVASLEADGHQARVHGGARAQGRPRRDGARSRPRPAAGVPARAARRRRSTRSTRTCRSPSSRSTARPRTTSARASRARKASPAPSSRSGSPSWRERIEHYREQRIHPQLPPKQVCCFYPMSKRRDGRRELVRAAVRGAQGAHGRPRARRSHLRGARAAADHRLDRASTTGSGASRCSPTTPSR